MAKTEIKSRRLVVAGLALIAVLIGAWFAVDAMRERRAARQAKAEVREIVSLLDLGTTPDFHQRLDKVRSFINDHSVHKIDEAFWANFGNSAAYAAGVIAHAKGAAEPVHMECSTRTSLMKQILTALGYQTRIVAIFDTGKNLNSHSFLEVMNPTTRRWETQDPDYDIYWRNKDNGERISVADAAETIDAIEPCGRLMCGWDLRSREGLKTEKLKSYLDIIGITDQRQQGRYALYTSRADLGRTYTKGDKSGLFCEVEAKRCAQGFYDLRTYSSYAAGQLR